MRAFLPSFAALVVALSLSLAAPAAHAQSTTVSCTSFFTPCVLPSGGIIVGGLPGMPSEVTSNSAGTFGFGKTIIGSVNLIEDLNTATDLDPIGNEATLTESQIFGDFNALSAKSANNTIIGYNNSASGTLGNLQITGVGNQVISDDDKITISGTHNIVSGTQGQHRGLTITGVDNSVDTSSGTYNGRSNTVRSASDSSITGVDNTLENADSSSITGTDNTLSGQDNSITGTGNTLSATSNSSITGVFNTLSGDSNSITGASNTLSGTFNSITGVGNTLSGTNEAIVGSFSSLSGTNGEMIVGSNSHLGPNAKGTIILGSGITSDRPNAAEFGGRVLSGVGDGTNLNDGVSLNQLNQAMAGFGGGASFLNGNYQAPSFVLTAPGAAGTYRDTNTALLALDNGINAVNTRIDNLPVGGGGTGPQGPAGPTGPQGPQGVDGTNGTNGKDGTGNGTDALAVHYDSASKTSVTLGGADANGTAVTPAVTLSNVADGAVNATSTQAVNGAQLYQTQQAAQAYTDQQVSNVKDWAKSYTDNKFAQARRDSDEAGAAGGAIGMLALSASRVSPEYRQNGNLSMSTGAYGHAGAIAMGWSQTYDNGRVGVAVAASWTGDHTFVGGSVSIGLDDLW
jgi:hypothetical protein